ncbi:ferrochelatase [Lacticaseibacillus saniviri]|uniref:ferrochelatase n=1 Tax=Lacticaseibacillus saniviri TaxID=931533 RepID=UPI000AEAD7F9
MHAILLVNLGTPDAPDEESVRRYLKQFLSDQRVIQMNPIKWQPILRTMILPKRPAKSAALYQQIWTEQGSPLAYYTETQAQLLQERLPNHIVRHAMVYGSPSIESVLNELRELEITKLTVLPLYPQYSSTTTASVFDQVSQYYQKQIYIPEIRMISDFSMDPDYTAAMAAKIDAVVNDIHPDQVVFSYHGIPQSYVDQGDPYAARCMTSTEAIVAQMTTTVSTKLTYQSRFGRDPWLLPATDTTLKKLPTQGIKMQSLHLVSSRIVWKQSTKSTSKIASTSWPLVASSSRLCHHSMMMQPSLISSLNWQPHTNQALGDERL